MGFGPALGEGVINTPHSSIGWSDRWVFAGEHLNRRAEELRILSTMFWISGLIVSRSGWVAALAEELIILCPLEWKGC